MGGHSVESAGNADRAYAALVRAIATCELPPGTAFNERDQASALGMSRTPLRQALHRLALEGLVETIPQRGVFVCLLDSKEIADNTVVREVLEVELLRQVIEQGIALDFPALDQLLQRMKVALESGDAVGFLEADEEFHLTLAGSAGNRPAREAIHRSWIHVNRVRYLQQQGTKGLAAALAEHRAMLTGLRRGDAQRTEAAVRAHMRRSRTRLAELTVLVPEAFVTSESNVLAGL